MSLGQVNVLNFLSGSFLRSLQGVYALLREKGKAFQWLEKTCEQPSRYPVINGDFVFEGLFDDPEIPTSPPGNRTRDPE